jgi:multidrug resistance efflux pump
MSEEGKNVEEIEKTGGEQPEERENKKEKKINPVIWTTRIVLLIAAIVFFWYVYSDRFTPYTDLARVTEIIIPVVPRVSGNLIDVKIKLHSVVKTNDLLFQIDTSQYALTVKGAEANIENVIQQLGAQSAAVKAAASAVGIARAQLDRAQRNYNRTDRIIKKNPGALSQVDIDRVETSLNQAVETLANAEANLTKAKKQLGPEGENNPQLKMAINQLDNAILQLSWTKIYAPTDGYIESFNLDAGYFAQAGKPLVTLVSKENLWIQANFKENNLSKMKTGDEVEFILDAAPGKVFKGIVGSIGYGVQTDNKSTPGDLPDIKSKSSWLQDSQRFPVVIEISGTDVKKLCRSGGQADVVVFTGDHSFLNSIARFRIRINSWLSYVR